MLYITDYSQVIGTGAMSWSQSDAKVTVYAPNGDGNMIVPLDDEKKDGGEWHYIGIKKKEFLKNLFYFKLLSFPFFPNSGMF